MAKSIISIADGYAWSMERISEGDIIKDSFAPLVAQQLVLGLTTCRDIPCCRDVDNKNAFHVAQQNVPTVAIAKTYKIVTVRKKL